MSGLVQSIPASVAKKLLAVMSDVNYIRKDKTNAFHKYNYASEQAIKEALHPILVKHGLLFLPIGCEIVSSSEITTSGGKKELVKDIKYFYRWLDAETGECSDILNSMGTGSDSSDKCVYKGITGALKYILTGTFLIPTGDDPDQDEAPRQAKEKQQAIVEKKLQQGKPKVDRSKAFADIKEKIGASAYAIVLKSWDVAKAEDLEDEPSKTAYRQMSNVLKIMGAAIHGELLPGISEEIFNVLPQASVAEVERQYLKKLTDLAGEEVAADDFEAIRAKAGTQWTFVNLLQARVTKLASEMGM